MSSEKKKIMCWGDYRAIKVGDRFYHNTSGYNSLKPNWVLFEVTYKRSGVVFMKNLKELNEEETYLLDGSSSLQWVEPEVVDLGMIFPYCKPEEFGSLSGKVKFINTKYIDVEGV